MSLLCTKQFTLAVAGGSTADAYYNCEALGTSGPDTVITDIVGGRNLIGGDPTEAGIISGIISNGIKLTNGIGVTDSWSAGTLAFWNFYGSSFTVRLWLKLTPGLTTGFAFKTGQFELSTQSDGFGGVNMYFGVDTDPGFEYLEVPITDASWHRYVLWYERGVGVGFKVDNAAPALYANTNELDNNFNQQLLLMGARYASGFQHVDEIGIWKKKLTTAELLSDWNSGAGKTYPNTP